MTSPGWNNRIVGYGEEAPADLLANPKNWRIHPERQQHALKGALSEIGWIQDVIVNRTTGYVVDGHARIALAMRHDQPTVPVKYVALSEAEEALAVATLDPIGALAAADRHQLRELLHEVSSGEEGLQSLLAELAEAEGIVPPDVYDDERDGEVIGPEEKESAAASGDDGPPSLKFGATTVRMSEVEANRLADAYAMHLAAARKQEGFVACLIAGDYADA